MQSTGLYEKPVIYEVPLIKELSDVTALCCIIGGCSDGKAAI